ncbi:hypothetical protein ACC723_39020, partial [Rhizobium ruizarguesonis]
SGDEIEEPAGDRRLGASDNLVFIGHGDLASVEELASGVQEVGAGEPRVGMADEDQIVGSAKPPITRRFFNFVAGDDE